MRLGVLIGLAMCVLGCGDDDIGPSRDAGFGMRDAAFDAGCDLPFYLAARDRNPDAGSNDGGLDALTCESFLDAGVRNDGTPDSECATIDWTFARGEQISLEGCCRAGQCGGLDPTGAVGCILRSVFGKSDMACTADHDIDSGDDDSGPPAI